MGYKILDKVELCPNQYELKIQAPYVTRNAKAGQFIIFRVEEQGERVPITIADVDRENGILTVVFMAVGYTTKKLAMLEVGDEIVDVVGPLGKPTYRNRKIRHGCLCCRRLWRSTLLLNFKSIPRRGK